MTYNYNTPHDRQEMFAAIGVESIDELFACIPDDLKLNRSLDLPPALSELELTQHLSKLAARNLHSGNCVNFLGGGSYDHFVPAVVDAIASRGEFYTSYTPYQPEVSQGNLQVMFEYQTLICQLTGMDVSNASLYDGGSATAEAVLLAMACTKRSKKVVVAGSVHPEFRQIIETNFANLDAELVTVAPRNGAVTVEDMSAVIDNETACILVQQPNFFGCIEELALLGQLAHDHGALFVVSIDPISVGLLKRPGDVGADVVVAEGQGLGTPTQYGGPYLGIMACREQFVRRMPGRIAGETVDRRGKRCWVLTLQTREQHIRREKATSNICTNQGLFALRTAIYLAALGPQGLRETAELCLQKAHYAAEQIASSNRFELAWDRPFFKEFVVRDREGKVEEVLSACRRNGILAGIPLGKWYRDHQDCFSVAVTEKRTKDEIDRLAEMLAHVESPSKPVPV